MCFFWQEKTSPALCKARHQAQEGSWGFGPARMLTQWHNPLFFGPATKRKHISAPYSRVASALTSSLHSELAQILGLGQWRQQKGAAGMNFSARMHLKDFSLLVSRPHFQVLPGFSFTKSSLWSGAPGQGSGLSMAEQLWRFSIHLGGVSGISTRAHEADWAVCSIVNKQHCTDLCHPKPVQDILVAQFPVSWKGITGMNTGNPNHTPQPKNIPTKATELNQTLCEKFFSTKGHLFQWSLPQRVHWD